MAFNIDNKTINKQIAAAKLKQKVIITSVVLLVVVAAWFILDYTTRREPTIDESFTALAAPFRFNINQNIFDSMNTKDRYTDEELADFSIFIVDENALARGNSLEVSTLGTAAPPSTDNVVSDLPPDGGTAAGAETPTEGELPENLQTDTGGPDFVQEV